jgi:naphthoate synthase
LKLETILYQEDGPIGWLTLNRPEDGNMFTPQMCHEVRDCVNAVRRETRTRVLVITGAGDKFFCIGGRKEGMEDTLLYAGVLPTLEMYEAIDKLQKPVIASVNGFAVGGGNVLQVVCDLTIAKESAVFRQVGPMMGSFDAGFGTWYLEDLIGKKKAKELWMLNPKLSAREAQAIGLINRVVPDDKLREETRAMALEVAERGAFALASINGFAVGGGNVLQMVCDLTIAKESAVFRQVGPMMGSFDAGYGTWYLEDLVGKKRAKEIWYRNPKMSATEALQMGLINKVVPDAELNTATRAMALEIAERGAFALASVKAAFNARHGGVAGLSRMAHDLLLRGYLDSDESKELSQAFGERRNPDPEKFGH